LLERAEARRAKRAETPALAAHSNNQASASAPSATPAPGPPPPSTAATSADPEAWLREISRLRAEGKVADAERELEAFRRAFPNHAGNALAKPPTR
jgi:hypothetical protein